MRDNIATHSQLVLRELDAEMAAIGIRVVITARRRNLP
jgi:hypothetical protein